MHPEFLSEKAKIISYELAKVRTEIALKIQEDPSFVVTPQVTRAVANKFFMDLSGKKEEMQKIENFYASGEDDYQIPLRKYTPKNVWRKFAIMFVHGGGWMQGNLETHDCLCRKIAFMLGAKVIAVDYRLAPEYIFPAALHDVKSAYLWCCENLDEKNIVISGDSAGGNLCASLCIKLFEEKYKKMPAAQILFYAALSNDLDSESFQKFGTVEALTKFGAMAYMTQYMGKFLNDPDTMCNKFLYPILQKDARAFPRTILAAAACDVLLDGQRAFAEKLKDAGISVDIFEEKDAVHGYMSYEREFKEEVENTLRKIDRLLSDDE